MASERIVQPPTANPQYDVADDKTYFVVAFREQDRFINLSHPLNPIHLILRLRGPACQFFIGCRHDNLAVDDLLSQSVDLVDHVLRCVFIGRRG